MRANSPRAAGNVPESARRSRERERLAMPAIRRDDATVKLGILSDSHGRHERTRNAVQLLLSRGAEELAHCGDIESEQVLDQLAGTRAHLVFGNCDPNWRALSNYALALDLQPQHPLARFELGGRSFALTHGHDSACVAAALAERVDYLLHGHTHLCRDERHGPTRIINPGALHRAAEFTVALLDTATDRLEFLSVS
ncbi:MAG: YfcE family phosphodiesterase [Planctomycetes bacterium]|nr:YfcE family phosphodiesterase [Planctomycetota bacterium]